MVEQDYIKAKKSAERAFKNAQAKGEYPYLPALDSIIQNSQILTEVPLGLVDIPLEQIAGTKTAGRQQAFACNFMPLMAEKSEFATKWTNLLKYQLSEGVKDPIIAYEFLNKYYVLEGNKRVSVFKYLGAYSIEGQVTRIVPHLDEGDPQIHIFYEYMEFYRKTAINYIWFSQKGSYAKLIKGCGKGPDDIWSEEERQVFSSRFLQFSKLFDEKGGKKLSITVGDAFLLYLDVYSYEAMDTLSPATLRSQLDKIWKEFFVLEESPDEALVMEPEHTEEAGPISKLLSSTGSRELKVAFIHEKAARDSGWVYAHELGRIHLQQTMAGKVSTTPYFMVGNEKDAGYEMITAAIEDGNEIIFTTSERFLTDSLKAAIAFPGVKILNCSVNRPYSALRTYYGRMYEAKLLEGMIAGAMCDKNRIAYAADYPIYGTMANINAFALGTQMTNPRARIYLHWNCLPDTSLQELTRKEDISIVSDVDTIRPGQKSRRFGLYRLEDGHYENLAAPIWNWGIFYEKIIRDITSGSWPRDQKSRKAMNYWWGMSGGIIDLIVSTKVPERLRRLIQIMRGEMFAGMMSAFEGPIIAQDGSVHAADGKMLTREEVITMDWLCENVVGYIPQAEEITAEARALIEVQGVIPTIEKKIGEKAMDAVKGIK